MANAFVFTVSAVDAATATIRRIKANIATVTEPVTKVKQAFASFGKEAGIEKIGASFKKIGGFVKDGAAALGKFVPGMAALAGIGTITGIAALADQFGKLGLNLSQTAVSLGLSTTQLQQWQLVGRNVGIDAKTMADNMHALGDAVEGAFYGTNVPARNAMAQLGMTFRWTKDGAVDLRSELIQLSAVIASRNGRPQAQENIARAFGVEALLPLLRQGPAAVQKQLDDAAKSGAIFSPAAVQNMDKTHQAIVNVENSWQALGATIAASPIYGKSLDKIAPMLSPGGMISTIVNPLVGIPAKILSALGAVGVSAVEVLASRYRKPFDQLLASVRPVVGELTMLWKGATGLIAADWKGLEFIGTAVWAAITGSVGRAGQSILNQAKSDWAQVIGFFVGVWDRIIKVFQAGVTGALSIMRVLPQWVTGLPDAPSAAANGQPAPAGQPAPSGTSGPVPRNNPGNIRPVGANRGFMTYPTMDAGVAAMARQLRFMQDRHGLNTLRSIISHYDPDPKEYVPYIAHVSKWTGWSPDQPLNLRDPATLARLEAAMIHQEQGRAVVSPNQVLAAIGQPAGAASPQQLANNGKVDVQVTVHHDGHRAHVRTRSHGPVYASARVAHSLHPIPA